MSGDASDSASEARSFDAQNIQRSDLTSSVLIFLGLILGL